MRKINARKGATSISILMLSIMAVFLATTALFVFAFKNSGVNSEIGNARIVESVYAKQEIVNYYLSQGKTAGEIESLVSGVKIEGDKITIVESLKEDYKEIITVRYVYNK